MRYTFDETIAEESGELSVFQVQTFSSDGEIEWVNIDDDQNYVVTTTNYNANGNDNWDAMYEAQANSANRYDVVIKNDTMVEAYKVERVEKMETA
ncbi:5'-nucleotidase [Vibrio astriarenae]|nr:5'-nucleotidase [Vibrio sp. C7]